MICECNKSTSFHLVPTRCPALSRNTIEKARFWTGEIKPGTPTVEMDSSWAPRNQCQAERQPIPGHHIALPIHVRGPSVHRVLLGPSRQRVPLRGESQGTHHLGRNKYQRREPPFGNLPHNVKQELLLAFAITSEKKPLKGKAAAGESFQKHLGHFIARPGGVTRG